MKKDYDELGNRIINLIGGKENVTYFAHCMTRLRFNLKDQSSVKTDELKKLPGLLGCQWANSQLQIIVGQDVTNVYDAIIKNTGLSSETAINELLDNPSKQKRSIKEAFGNLFSTIAGCVAPCINVLIVAGLLQSVIAILTQFCGVDPKSSTIVVLGYASTAAMYFLPIYVGANSAKKFGASQSMGMFMGALLLVPGFVSAISDGTALTIFSMPIKAVSYGSTVFPVMLSCYVLGYVERFFNKHISTYVRAFLAPLCTAIVMIPLVYVVIGPIGSYLSTYLVAALVWFHSVTGPIGVGLVAVLYPFMVATGLHVGMSPIMVETFSQYGYENLFYPAGCIANECQGFASLAVALKTKNKDVKATAVAASIPAILGKVTEPAIYGVCFKYKIPECCAMIGEFIGGIFAGIVGTKIYYFGGGGLLGFAGYIGGSNAWELPLAIAGILIAGAITFTLTYFFFDDQKVGIESI